MGRKSRPSMFNMGRLRDHALEVIDRYPGLGPRVVSVFKALIEAPVRVRGDSLLNMKVDHGRRLGDVDLSQVMIVLDTLDGVIDDVSEGVGGELLTMMVWQFSTLLSARLNECRSKLGVNDVRRDGYIVISSTDKGNMTSRIGNAEVLFRVPSHLSSCTVTVRDAFGGKKDVTFRPGGLYPAALLRCPFSTNASWGLMGVGYPGRFKTDPAVHTRDDYVGDYVDVRAEARVPVAEDGTTIMIDDVAGFADVMNDAVEEYFSTRVFLPVGWIVAHTPHVDYSPYEQERVVEFDDAWLRSVVEAVVEGRRP